MSGNRLDVPVLIIGAGPAGMAHALALSRYGIDYLVVERHAGTAHTPRAHLLTQRTAEILRDLGIEQRVLDATMPRDLMRSMMRNNLFVTSLADREIARTEAWGSSDQRFADYSSASPCLGINIPQIDLEPVLLEAVRDAGGDVRFDHEFESYVEGPDGVTSTVRNRLTGEAITVHSKYLVGADGARSKVMDSAGLGIDGPAGLGYAANIWFEADLSKYFSHRPALLTWSVAPGPLPPLRLGTLICHKPFDEFVLVVWYDPLKDDVANWPEDETIRRVHAMIGDDTVAVRIKSVAKWEVNAQVAPQYSKGRAFCMGDAVHRHPPANGLGLNMSIADSYNLAWKFALVLKGKAGPGLLESYSLERQPAGHQGVTRAITSVQDYQELDVALGFTPDQSVEEGRAALVVLDEPGPAGDEKRAALRKVMTLIDYQFNAQGIELGYRYKGPAIVADPTPEAPPARDPQLFYHPTTRPGARVPHARIERDSKQISTIDLVNGLEFVLLTGIGGEQWAEVADEIATRTGVPITVYTIGGNSPQAYLDVYGDWSAVCEIETSGCILVRPDRHVAWRAARLDTASLAALPAVMDQVLALVISGTRDSLRRDADISAI